MNNEHCETLFQINYWCIKWCVLRITYRTIEVVFPLLLLENSTKFRDTAVNFTQVRIYSGISRYNVCSLVWMQWRSQDFGRGGGGEKPSYKCADCIKHDVPTNPTTPGPLWGVLYSSLIWIGMYHWEIWPHTCNHPKGNILKVGPI